MNGYHELKRDAAIGLDGLTWSDYEGTLEERLKDLHSRVHCGSYRARPSRRTYIPKPDGGRRPLGVAALEDKIVQKAMTTVLNCIYEVDFQGFSYGFRPGRGAQQALDALWVGLVHGKVNWVLDADIRGFFDTIDHAWLLKFIEHRIGDRRVIRLIAKWLRAGVLEDGRWTKTLQGTPQGSVISPLLANVYLHYVFDLWVQQWRSQSARGQVIVVRYAVSFRQACSRWLPGALEVGVRAVARRGGRLRRWLLSVGICWASRCEVRSAVWIRHRPGESTTDHGYCDAPNCCRSARSF